VRKRRKKYDWKNRKRMCLVWRQSEKNKVWRMDAHAHPSIYEVQRSPTREVLKRTERKEEK